MSPHDALRGPELPYAPTMPAVIRRAAEQFGDDDFVVLPDRRITFRDAEAASRGLAKRFLAAGVGKGTRVGIHLPTGPEWAVAWIAAARIGALAMPFSTIFRPAELRTALRVGDVAVLVAAPTMLGKDHETFLEDAVPGLAASSGEPLRVPELPYLRAVWLHGSSKRRWAHTFSLASNADNPIDGVGDDLLAAVEAEVTPADLLTAVFTSGTSAAPKVVLHSHGALLRKTAPQADAGLNASFPGRVLSFMPFFWIGGMQSVAGALHSGATVLTVERLDAQVAFDLAVAEQATSIQGNATVLQSLLGAADGGRALPSLRPLHQRPWEPDPDARGDTRHALGMTETAGVWASVTGFECRVVDPESGAPLGEGAEGEFRVRGYGVMQGLYKREREDVFTADGFYRTGDIGAVKDGYVHFRGRLIDTIKTKGANVAPAEVQAVLDSFGGVRVSFVVGLAHEQHGQIVAAAIVPEPGHTVDVDALLEHARRSLSPYKVPTLVDVIADADLRWLPSGKADVRAIAALLDERRQTRRGDAPRSTSSSLTAKGAAVPDIVQYQNLIGGELRPAASGRWLDSINPATGAVWARVPASDRNDADAAVAAASAAFPSWAGLPAVFRGEIIRGVAKIFLEHGEELARLETVDNGRTLRENRERNGHALAFLWNQAAGEAVKAATGSTVILGPNSFGFTRREPYGVVAAIIPWNAPISMMSLKAAAAIAAGNTVVVKPAEQACASVLRFGELLGDLLPPGVLNIVAGLGEEVGDPLVRHPAVRKVTLTGSTQTGRLIQRAAADTLTQTIFELGGKSPNIVFADADLDIATQGLTIDSVYTGNAGQACVAGSRILVQRPVYDEVVDRIRGAAANIVLGDPLEEATTMGPLVSAAQYDRVVGYLELGRKEADLVFGGRHGAELVPHLPGGYWVEPTLFATTDNSVRICQEEIFGPVAAVIPFDTDEEAVAIANASDYGLAAGLWTRDLGRAHRFISDLQVGNVWVNAYKQLRPELPFGGYKDSGYGHDSTLEFTQEKTAVITS